MAREITPYESQLIELIRPLRTAKWSADYRWDTLESSLQNLGADYGGLELIPDFQRGHVWTEAQQVHFIENVLRGVVSRHSYQIQFNCPQWNEDPSDSDLPKGLQCVDGLQRFTAITRFVRGEVKPFGLSASDLAGTQFEAKRIHTTIGILDFTKRVDLLEHYLSINVGGTPHSAEEIARVRALLAEAKAKQQAG